MEYLRSSGKGTYVFGTWNIQGLNNPIKKHEVFNEIERENVDVVVLTETKLKGSGQEEIKNYRHFYNGVKSDPARAGVSIIVKKSLGQFEKVECQESGSQESGQTETMEERIITGRLIIDGREIIIIGVYGINDTDKLEIKDNFFRKFRDELNKWKEHELMILGDFNSKVGTSTESKVVGNFGDKDTNNNGERLKRICEDFGLKIQNTFFDHEDIHKYTWYHKVYSSKSLIDYFITKQETTLHVHDVLACRWLECGTDHVFLEASISFLTENIPKVATPEYGDCVSEDSVLEMRKYKSYLLFSKTVRDSFKNYLDSIINESDRSTEKIYKNLKESIHSAAYNKLGMQNKDLCGEFLWDQEIKDLRAKRKLPYQTTPESNFDQIQNEVWEGICLTINNLKRNERSKAALQILYQMLNKENKCAEHFGSSKDVNSDSNKYVPEENKIDPKKTLQIRDADVTKALNELEDDAIWPVPVGITMQLLRNCSEKSKKLLTLLIRDIFMGKDMPFDTGKTFEIGGTPLFSTHSIMRVLCSIVKEKIEDEIGETEFSLPQLNHLDATFTLRLYLQKNSKRNCQCVIINLKPFYQNVQYSKLFEILSGKYKISENLLAILEKLIKYNTIKVLEHVLRPVLFKLYIEETVKQYINELKIVNSTCIHMFSNDNLIVFSVDYPFEKIKKIIETLCDKFKSNLNFVIKKQNLKYLGKKKLNNSLLEIESENVIDFDGTLLELNGSCEKDVYKRITTTKNVIAYLHPVLRNKRISIGNKSRIFDTIIRNILLDGSETWTLTREMEESINSLEKYYWKWCNPCNILLANLKLGKLEYNDKVTEMSEEKYPLRALKDLKEIQVKGKIWTNDIDEIQRNKIKYEEDIERYIEIFNIFYNRNE